MRREQIERWAIWSGFLYFLVSINPFFVWIKPSVFIGLSFLALLFASVCLGKLGSLSLTKRRFAIVGIALIFILIFAIRGKYITIINFTSFALMILWPSRLLFEVYEIFKKTMYICAVGSLIISALFAVDLLQYLPYIEFPAQSTVQEMQQTTNRVYGFVSTNYTSWKVPYGMRACGPLQEPGHFAIFLGIIYFFETAFNRRVRIWFILAGVATFSANFLIMFLMAQTYAAFVNKKMFRIVKWGFAICILVVTLFFCLPKSIQEPILFMAYERNLESVIDAVKEGGIAAAISERTNTSGEAAYGRFLRDPLAKWIGMQESFGDGSTVLSDYRGALYVYGYIGLILFAMLSLFSVQSKNLVLSLGLFCIMALIFIHRSWMMTNSAYIYLMIVMGLAAYSYLKEKEQALRSY